MEATIHSNDHSNIAFKCIKGKYKDWMTISSLSARIFFDFFCTHTIKSPTDDKVL